MKRNWFFRLASLAIMSIVLFGSYNCAAAPDKDLVLHWKLDGDFRDSSGNNNHGMPSGSISFADNGANNSYAAFSGGMVNIPANKSLVLGGQFTVSLWLRLASDDDGCNPDVSLVAKENTDQQKNWGDYQLRLKSQGTHDIIFSTAQMTNGFEPIAGTSGVGSYELHSGWSLVSVVFDGDQIIIYINGSKEMAAAAKDRDDKRFKDEVPGQWFIGSLPGGKNHLDGGIDDLRIYKRALSAEEIRQLFNQH